MRDHSVGGMIQNNKARWSVSRLTKSALAVTCLSAVALLVTGNVSQALVSDGKHMYCIVTWNIPFYRSMRLPGDAWWTFTRIWLFSLLAPPVLWIAVRTKVLASRLRKPSI